MGFLNGCLRFLKLKGLGWIGWLILPPTRALRKVGYLGRWSRAQIWIWMRDLRRLQMQHHRHFSLSCHPSFLLEWLEFLEFGNGWLVFRGVLGGVFDLVLQWVIQLLNLSMGCRSSACLLFTTAKESCALYSYSGTYDMQIRIRIAWVMSVSDFSFRYFLCYTRWRKGFLVHASVCNKKIFFPRLQYWNAATGRFLHRDSKNGTNGTNWRGWLTCLVDGFCHLAFFVGKFVENGIFDGKAWGGEFIKYIPFVLKCLSYRVDDLIHTFQLLKTYQVPNCLSYRYLASVTSLYLHPHVRRRSRESRLSGSSWLFSFPEA